MTRSNPLLHWTEIADVIPFSNPFIGLSPRLTPIRRRLYFELILAHATRVYDIRHHRILFISKVDPVERGNSDEHIYL